MSSRRSSAPNCTNQQVRANLWLSPTVLRTAGRTVAMEAQRQIEERHRKAAEPKKRAGGHKYSQAIVDEIKAMRAAGWPPREIIRVMNMPKQAVMGILYYVPDGMSAAQAKRAR